MGHIPAFLGHIFFVFLIQFGPHSAKGATTLFPIGQRNGREGWDWDVAGIGKNCFIFREGTPQRLQLHAADVDDRLTFRTCGAGRGEGRRRRLSSDQHFHM